MSVRTLVSGISISLLSAMLLGAAAPVRAELGELQIEIKTPEDQEIYTATRQSIELEGIASLPGAVAELDLMLVLDTSRSLKNSDPYGYRFKGAIQLLDTLPERGNVRVGIVGFSRRAELAVPLTANRKRLVDGIRNLGRGSLTEISEGLRLALDVLRQYGRPGASHAILVFTDGRSDPDAVRAVTETARTQEVAIHSLLLGGDGAGTSLLESTSQATGGTFEQVKRSKDLDGKFADLRTTGVEQVTIRINDGEAMPGTLEGDRFSLPLDLVEGSNRIVATATSMDGRMATDAITLTLRAPSCGELQIVATVGGQPAVSVAGRSVEMILDSSGSMWGRTDGRIKMTVAKRTLEDVLSQLPSDLQLGLRAYGHRHDRDEHDCRDTERLVEPGPGDRDRIRTAIASLKPRGQTPIAYSLQQAASDLRNVPGERAVVLLTDGIESCRGDGPAAARALQELGGIPVHVIGFGMESAESEDLARLEQIAQASNGRFFTASDASQLREALTSAVGTPWSVLRDGGVVARGTLGADDPLALPAGTYEVRLESQPPVVVPIEIGAERHQRLSFETRGGRTRHASTVEAIERFTCDLPTLDGAPPVD